MNVKNHYVNDPGQRRVHFGVHVGKLFKEVPEAYLLWLINTTDGVTRNNSNRKRWARQELVRRGHLMQDINPLYTLKKTV